MTQKAQLQSAGDGTAVPTGYVGEYKEALGNYTACLLYTSDAADE